MQTIQVQDNLHQNLNKYSLDKNFFNKCLKDIKNNKINLISHDGAWENIDKLTNQSIN
jgi:hypothetical protein